MIKTVLVVAAHTDDEALGCAGTIAKHVAKGNKVHLLFMTDGIGARGGTGNEGGKRLMVAKKAAEILGVASFTNLSFPDNRMDSVPLLEIVKEIELQISELQPQIIYTHHIGDLNVDHQVTHRAVMTACRPQPSFCVKEIYAFEVLSSTEWQTPNYMSFAPTMFVDISDYWYLKKKALQAYSLEMRGTPHSRSFAHLECLAKHRGYSIGVEAAEAFMALRLLF